MSAQLSSAVHVPLRGVSEDEWNPQPQQCHDNVEHWVKSNPDHEGVYGWLLMDFRAVVVFGAPGFVDLLPHAVVRDSAQRLVDITPRHELASDDTYPFLLHAGSREDFYRLVDGLSIARVRIYLDEMPPKVVYYSI